MKILKTICCVLLATAALYGCGKDEGSRGEDTQRVKALFSAGIGSRASDESWHEGDNVGITMLVNGQSDVLDEKHNRQYTCPNGTGNFDPCAGQAIYYPLDGTKVDFVGYYPYTDDLIGHKVPVDVSSQNYLPNIDVMTFDRYSGASKNNASVSVKFRHRLSKLIFAFAKEDQTTSKRITKLEIHGMLTTGSYDMVENVLEADADSEQMIAVPVDESGHTGSAVALVLPREAGEGIVFHITLEHEFESQTYYTYYEVPMPETLELKEGMAHRFNILLRDKETPAEISATIVEWGDGGTEHIASKPLTIEQTPGATDGFSDGARITLWCGDTKLSKYTYAAGSWTPDSPVYWEYVGDGHSPTVGLRAMYVRAGKLNPTQMPEVAMATLPEAKRFEPLALAFKLQPAKVVFELVSEDGGSTREFTDEDLELATIVLPDYITGYDMKYGAFTIHEDQRGDVTVAGRHALIVPQEKSGLVALVTLYGNSYRVETGSEKINFEAGMVTTIKVNMTKNDVTMSASFTEWIDDGTEIALTPVVAASGVTTAFEAGDSFALYYTKGDFAVKTKIGDYTYEGSNVWRPAAPVYWEEIEDRADYDFQAVCKLNKDPMTGNQMEDWMYAENTGATKFGLLDLHFYKQTSRIVVRLNSPDSGDGYTLSELGTASVILPGYRIGGTYDGIEFKTGTLTGDVIASKAAGQLEWTALVESQTIAKDKTFIKIDMGNGNVYNVKAPEIYNFETGVTSTFTVTVRKTGITFSASYTEWTAGYDKDLDTDLDT